MRAFSSSRVAEFDHYRLKGCYYCVARRFQTVPIFSVKRLALSAAIAGSMVGLIVFTLFGWAFVNIPSMNEVKYRSYREAEEHFSHNARVFERRNYKTDNTDDPNFDIVAFVRRNDIYEYSDSFLGILNAKLANEILKDVNQNKIDREIMRRHIYGIDGHGGYDTSDTLRIKDTISYTYYRALNFVIYFFALTINLLIFVGIFVVFSLSTFIWVPSLARRWLHWVSGGKLCQKPALSAPDIERSVGGP